MSTDKKPLVSRLLTGNEGKMIFASALRSVHELVPLFVPPGLRQIREHGRKWISSAISVSSVA